MLLIINTLILIVTLISPFVVIYAISLAKKKKHAEHIKIQKITFYICIIAILTLEAQIRFMGGSGSLSANSPYVNTDFYSFILIAHIMGAVLTYIIWIITIYLSSWHYSKKKNLPGSFTKVHKTLGKITLIGLFYSGISALIVYVLTFVL